MSSKHATNIQGANIVSDLTQDDPQASSFWAPASLRPEIWRTLLGFILIHAVFFGVTFVVFITGAALSGSRPEQILAADTPFRATVFFLTFLGYHLGVFLVIRLLHKRSFRSLLGPSERVNWQHFRRGLYVALAISVAAIALQIILSIPFPPENQETARQSMPFSRWALLVTPAIALVFVQIFAEELVFRGYVLQQIRARFKSVWVWAVLPSLAFGILHFDTQTYGINAYFYVLHTTVVGVILSVVTLKTGNIGAAAGLHFANNAMLLVSATEGAMDGFSLFLVPADLTSAATSASIVQQTGLVILVFVIWWKRTQRHRPIANAVKSD